MRTALIAAPTSHGSIIFGTSWIRRRSIHCRGCQARCSVTTFGANMPSATGKPAPAAAPAGETSAAYATDSNIRVSMLNLLHHAHDCLFMFNPRSPQIIVHTCLLAHVCVHMFACTGLLALGMLVLGSQWGKHVTEFLWPTVKQFLHALSHSS